MNLILWIAVIAYALWPMDLLPDVFAGLGWLDDLILLFLAWRFMKRGGGQAFFRGADPFAGYRRGGTRYRRPDGDAGPRPAGRERPPADPCTRLGVAPDASADQIKQAYRALAAQYHPDKVAHLGTEFQELAEERFKQIQEAYQELKRLGRV